MIATRPAYNLQEFNDALFGSPSEREIWALESRVLAHQLALCAALADKVCDTARKLENREGLGDKIKNLMENVVTAHGHAKDLCDTLGATR